MIFPWQMLTSLTMLLKNKNFKKCVSRHGVGTGLKLAPGTPRPAPECLGSALGFVGSRPWPPANMCSGASRWWERPFSVCPGLAQLPQVLREGASRWEIFQIPKMGVPKNIRCNGGLGTPITDQKTEGKLWTTSLKFFITDFKWFFQYFTSQLKNCNTEFCLSPKFIIP